MEQLENVHLRYESKIWNLFTIRDAMLLIELRDERSLSTSYDLYDFSLNSFVWRSLKLDESWRTGFSYADPEVIIFHRFKKGTVPEIENITAISIDSGEVVWTNDEVQPIEFGRESIRCLKNEEEVFISIRKGTPWEGNINFLPADVMKVPVLPLTYSEDSGNFATVKNFLRQSLKETPVGPVVEYLEYSNRIFIGYHTGESPNVKVRLISLSEKGNIWLNEQVEESEKFISDIFFLWHDYLVYIEGRHSLKAINLKGV